MSEAQPPGLTDEELETFRSLRTVNDEVIREFAELVLQSASGDSDSEVTKS
jgi:hypothetical protein